MLAFRLFLAAFFAVLFVYTVIVGLNHGWNLAPVFLGDIAKMAWPGQFNLDFFGYLMLSALWVAWRHQFTPGGLALGAVALVGGMMFLAVYLFIAAAQAGGDAKTLLMGPSRAHA